MSENFLIYTNATSASQCRFDLIYIDNNTIPELVISEGNSREDGMMILTCYKSEISILMADEEADDYTFGSYGTLSYLWNNNVFVDYDESDTKTVETLYSIQNGYNSYEAQLIAYTDASGDYYESWSVNGESVTSEEYDYYRSLYDLDQMDSICHDDMYAINQTNIDDMFL